MVIMKRYLYICTLSWKIAKTIVLNLSSCHIPVMCPWLMQDLVARPPQVHKYHQLMVKHNLEEKILRTTEPLCSVLKLKTLWEGVMPVKQHLMYLFSVRTIPPLERWRAFESAPLTMESPHPLSPLFHSLPTLTLQRIQLWLEKPLSFQSLQSFDHNEFQSLSPPTLCSHLTVRRRRVQNGETESTRHSSTQVFFKRIIRRKLRSKKSTEWK